MSKTILITNGRSPAGLDLLRTLTQSGHKVLVAESFPVHVCQFSRFGRSIRVPPPGQKPHEYITRIKQIVSRLSVDLIIPIYEEIFPLSFFRQELGCEIFCNDFPLLKRLHNKFQFIELCREHGCSYPETQLISSANEIVKPDRKVIKPMYSRFGTDVHIQPSARAIGQLDFSTPWVLQDFVDGDPYCGFCIANDGQVLLHSIYPVEATFSGVCINFRHEAVQKITDWMYELVGKTGFTGSIGFDFIYKDQTVYPIECNPRITSGIHLFSRQQELVDALIERKPLENPSYPPSIIGPFVLAKAIFDWSLWKKWFSCRDVVFNWLDPLPLVGQGVALVHLLLSARRKGMPMSQASSLDIDFNGKDFDLQE